MTSKEKTNVGCGTDWAIPATLEKNYSSNPTYPIQPGYPVKYADSDQVNTNIVQPPPYTIVVDRSGNTPDYESGNISHSTDLTDVESPKQAIPENFSCLFSTREIRHKFVRKVYSILTLQLMVSLGIVAVFTLHEGVRTFVQREYWLQYTAFAFFPITYLSLICCRSARRKWPTNIILLSIFTLSMSYLLGVISSRYRTETVLLAVGITAIICFLITMFAIQTKIDFTGWSVYLLVASSVLLIFIVVGIFMRNPILHLICSAGIILIFSMFLIFDTQAIIGGRKYSLSPEEYIAGALILYLDIINIFLGLLGISRYN